MVIYADRTDSAAHVQHVEQSQLVGSTCWHSVCQEKGSFPNILSGGQI